MHTDCHLSNCEQCDLERAVIKAAEALAALHGAILDGQPVSGEAMSDALKRNYDAVRALQEARDE